MYVYDIMIFSNIPDFFREVWGVVLSSELQMKLLPLKVFALSFTALFAAFLVFVLIKTRWAAFYFLYDSVEFFTLKHYGVVSASRKWRKIKRHTRFFDENAYKEAIVRSQAILDKMLKSTVPLYQATDFNKRIAMLGAETLPNIKDIPYAYGVCGKIISDPSYKLTAEEGRGVIKIYEDALRELGVG